MPPPIDHGDSANEVERPLEKVAGLLAGLSEEMGRWQVELALAQAQVKPLAGRSCRNCQEQDGSALLALPCERAIQLVVDSLAEGTRRILHVRSSESPFLDRLTVQGVAWPDPRLSVRELISRPTCLQHGVAGQNHRVVRTTWTRLHEVLIIDDTVALIPSPGAAEVTVIQHAAVVRQLTQFFEASWMQAAQPQESVPVPDGTGIELKHRIVQLLADGAKDETVARRLGISLRTCRRHVAEILDQLGASSRFQAGFRAARLGKVPTVESP
ncbi:response regulator transcription factor [Kitasatospora griseola]|uniref:helix-turn-helix transcriptional regulator n=1 Tax=Kitasatospora griseola TaxID=2064 RepID=UPI003855F195